VSQGKKSSLRQPVSKEVAEQFAEYSTNGKKQRCKAGGLGLGQPHWQGARESDGSIEWSLANTDVRRDF